MTESALRALDVLSMRKQMGGESERGGSGSPPGFPTNTEEFAHLLNKMIKNHLVFALLLRTKLRVRPSTSQNHAKS